MKHILYFFDARKGSRIDLFWARSDIYVVNFDLFVFIEGVIFQKGHSYIKVAGCYGDSWVQRFLMVSSHLHRKIQFCNLFYLVKKISKQKISKKMTWYHQKPLKSRISIPNYNFDITMDFLKNDFFNENK